MIAFAKISLDILRDPILMGAIMDYCGESMRIEQSLEDWRFKQFTISWYTDIEFKEGEDRQVVLQAETTDSGVVISTIRAKDI